MSVLALHHHADEGELRRYGAAAIAIVLLHVALIAAALPGTSGRQPAGVSPAANPGRSRTRACRATNSDRRTCLPARRCKRPRRRRPSRRRQRRSRSSCRRRRCSRSRSSPRRRRSSRSLKKRRSRRRRNPSRSKRSRNRPSGWCRRRPPPRPTGLRRTRRRRRPGQARRPLPHPIARCWSRTCSASNGFRPAAEMRGSILAQVTFTVSRSGGVSGVRLTKSTGSPAFDQEALAWIQRAQPMPSFPSEMREATSLFTAPLSWEAR